jgi:hypothetical protein
VKAGARTGSSKLPCASERRRQQQQKQKPAAAFEPFANPARKRLSKMLPLMQQLPGYALTGQRARRMQLAAWQQTTPALLRCAALQICHLHRQHPAWCRRSQCRSQPPCAAECHGCRGSARRNGVRGRAANHLCGGRDTLFQLPSPSSAKARASYYSAQAGLSGDLEQCDVRYRNI